MKTKRQPGTINLDDTPVLELPDLPRDPSGTVRRIIVGLSESVDEIEDSANALVVKDEASQQIAVEMAVVVKQRIDELEKQRKEKGEPFRQVWAGINSYFKPWADRLKSAKATIDRKSESWFLAEQQKRREREQKQREREQKRIAEGKSVTPRRMPEPLPQSVRSESGASASMRETWDFEVIDAKKVPRKYLMINDKLVLATIQAEGKVMPEPSPIPGLRLFRTAKQVTRRAASRK